MVRATCENNDCGRDVWDLRKHPSEYAGGGPSCPDCGTTRIAVEGDAGAPPEQAPARKQRQGGQAPARQDSGMDTVASVFALTDGEVPTQQKAEAAQNVLGTLGGVAKRLFEYQDQKRQAREQRVENASLERADLPTCGECEYQFAGDDIPLGSNRVRCPECNAVYNLNTGGGA